MGGAEGKEIKRGSSGGKGRYAWGGREKAGGAWGRDRRNRRRRRKEGTVIEV